MVDTKQSWNEEYDFVVVGGGTSGLVLADRLSESGKHSVLVLEAGAKPDLFKMYQAPGGVPFVTGTPLDWRFETEPQENLNGRRFTYHRGRTLGGSSVINGLFYGRGSAGVYDRWAQLGNDGWGWKDVYPHFVKGTHFNPSTVMTEASQFQTWDPSAYGDGPLEIGYQGYVPDSSVGFIEACEAIDIPIVDELNTGNGVGIKQGTGTIDSKYHRSSAYDGYYKRAISRENLDILDSSPVLSIKFNGETTSGKPKASGVIFVNHSTGLYHSVNAKKEVVVALGTFQSPQLLMVSGIGPKATLEAQGIKPVHTNDNVGKHMIDHNVFSIMVSATPESCTHRETYHLDTLQAAQNEFYTKGSGPYTAPTGITNAYQQLSADKLDSLGAKAITDAGHFNQSHMEFLYESVFYPNNPTPTYTPSDDKSYITVTASNMVPLSRGTVSIKSKLMSDAPVIDPNYYSCEVDKHLAINAFRDLRKLLAHPSLAKYAVGPHNGEVSPGPEAVSTDDDNAIWDYIRSITSPGWHPVGTNRMMPDEKEGVVDARLRVHGVENLRIVDSSIMPTIPDVCIQGPVYMIGEKGADMILQDWEA